MTRRGFLLLFALGAVVLVSGSRAQLPPGSGPPVWGYVLRQGQIFRPVGGVTVSLVHPVLGRSAPAYSAPNGYFYFANVPPRNDPYYIEAYWGTELLYRAELVYQGGSLQFNIPLP
jgi:hypothetical protein